MVGMGAEVFCIWPYIISKMRLSRGMATVMLNPALLKEVFGVDEGFVKRGVERLCAPDKASKNGTQEQGRRIKHVSGFMYQVVNGAEYIAIRSREKHAEAQAKYRDKKKGIIANASSEENLEDLADAHAANAEAHLNHASDIRAKLASNRAAAAQ